MLQLIRTSSRDDRIFISTLITLALVLGIFVRVEYISHSNYPLNDGGLFYQMTEDLLDNGFQLPKYTTYNQAKIVYAYPPLGFYLAGMMHSLFEVDLLQIFRYLPFTINILTLFVFIFFVSDFTEKKFHALISLYFFALLPRSYEWFVMGGGLTRSLGFMFSILAARSIWRMYRTDRIQIVTVSSVILYSSLTIYSHPETSLFLIFLAFVFFIFHSFSWEKVRASLIVVMGVLFVTAPWYITLIRNHGIKNLVAALGSGQHNWLSWKILLTQNYGLDNKYFLSIYGVLAIIGAFSQFSRQVKILTVIIIAGYPLFPRSGINLLTPYAAILSGAGFCWLLNHLPGKIKSIRDKGSRHLGDLLQKKNQKIFFAFILMTSLKKGWQLSGQ